MTKLSHILNLIRNINYYDITKIVTEKYSENMLNICTFNTQIYINAWSVLEILTAR